MTASPRPLQRAPQPQPQPQGPHQRRPRLTHWIVPFWLTAAGVVSVVHRWVPESTWLMIHLVALGAVTQAVVHWSGHFAEALLKVTLVPTTARLTLPLAAATALVLVGVPTGLSWVTVAGASGVGIVALLHGWRLARALRRALPGRFRIVVRYYVAAAACLPVGATFGVLLARGQDDTWHARLLLAHTLTNLLGWLGLTVAATMLTLWPTVLRTRADAHAERLARQALPVLLGGWALSVGGSLLGTPQVAAAGLALYAAGLVWTGRALLWVWREFRRLHGPGTVRERPARAGYAGGALGLAWLWFAGAVLATAGVVLGSEPGRPLVDAYQLLVPVWVVGFALQLLTGALTYLLPTVLHGGSSVFDAGWAYLERAAGFRLTVLNGGLLLWLVPLPSWVRVTVSMAVLAVLAAFVVLLVLGVRASARQLARVRAAREAGQALPPPAPIRPGLTPSGLLTGVSALALAVALGVLADPAAAGLPTTDRPAAAASGEVAPTGQTVRVRVEARDMRFIPDRVEADAGDRVVIDLVNTDPANPHDLDIAGVRSARLAPGQSATLDLGVVAASTQGWCTVVGHRQMGMVLDVVVAGTAATTAPGATAPAASTGTMAGHAAPAGGSAHGRGPAGAATPAPLTSVVDPTTRPTTERVHRVTLRVTEVPLEVAPGVWQQRWTYNGASVGPTLRGRVGDVFEVTLVNDGTIGHSIDFHAGELAPDQPMRTIAPGQSLEYRFTATHSGIWMYHCSTMPMSAHIAAGMHGAVIIDPPEGLPPVDREYVLVQSEVFVAATAVAPAAPAAAAEVDADSVNAETPTFVVFNGIAGQYDQQPFVARVGERVRFWVLDAGPSRPSSFHIVGGQFDTVYSEGAYQLKKGRDAFGQTTGGAQVLPLQPAQGGFVELVFREAGHYPVVSHVMTDAERGAHGIVTVTG